MLLRLTKRAVDGLEPRTTPYEIVDVELKGFLLRLEPGGTRSWFYTYRHQGARKRILLGRYPGLSCDGARSLATAAAGDVAKGIDVQGRKKVQRTDATNARQATLSTFLVRYTAWEEGHRKIRHGKVIKSVFPKSWLAKPLTDLNTWLIEGWRRDERKRGKKPSSINRDLAALKAVIGKAVEWGVISSHPLAGLKMLKIDSVGHVRFLEVVEEQRLRTALRNRDAEMRARRARFNVWRKERHESPLPPYPETFSDHLEPLILLLLNTGMRFGEVANLRHRDVNMKDRLITVAGEGAKSGKTRVIPMNLEAHRILSAHKGAPAEYAFPGIDGG